jgi:phosphatidylinositol glycan anchor class Y biosynthesis protein
MSRKSHQNTNHNHIYQGACFPYPRSGHEDDDEDADDRQEEYDQLVENTTLNSLSANVQSEALFTKLGLRHFGRIQHSAKARLYGYGIVVAAIIVGVLFLYCAIVSKYLPDSGNAFLDGIKHDHYFCYLLPLTIFPTMLARYVNWLARQHFEQN